MFFWNWEVALMWLDVLPVSSMQFIRNKHLFERCCACCLGSRCWCWIACGERINQCESEHYPAERDSLADSTCRHKKFERPHFLTQAQDRDVCWSLAGMTRLIWEDKRLPQGVWHNYRTECRGKVCDIISWKSFRIIRFSGRRGFIGQWFFNNL